jgi:hypothetical protein
MKKRSDKFLANFLLKRSKAKSSLPFFYKANLKHYLICVSFFAGVMAFCWFLMEGNIPLLLFALGVFWGTVARDLRWFISMKKGWPFTEKVINWEKVAELADIEDDTK